MKVNWLGLTMMSVVAMFALACGSSDDSVALVPSIANIDSSLDTDTIDKAKLYKVESSGNAASSASYQSDVTAGTGDADHTATFYNVASGEYLLKVEGTNGSDLYQAPVEVANNTISGLGKAVPTYFQVNAFTTYVVLKALEGSGNLNDVATVVDEVLGTTLSLKDVFFDGGSLRLASSGAGASLTSDNLMTAINYVALVVTQAAKIETNSSSANTAVGGFSDILTTIIGAGDSLSDLADATSDANLLNILTEVNSSTNLSDLEAILGEDFVDEIVGSGDNLLDFADVVVAELISAAFESTNDSFEIQSFALVDYSFGWSSGNEFTLNSLAPVFKLTFADNVKKDLVASAIAIELNKVGGASYDLKASDATVQYSWASGSELYIAVKADGLAITDKELEPGAVYNYSINTDAFVAQDNIIVGIYGAGNIAVSDLTLTSEMVPVAIDGTSWNGLTAAQVSFNINTADEYSVAGNSSSGNLGFYLTATGENDSKYIDTSYFSLDAGTDDAGVAVTSFSSIESGDNLVSGTLSIDDAKQAFLSSGNYSLMYETMGTLGGTLNISIE
jgi:hypothetical protein